MADPNEKEKKNGFSLDWLVGGALTRIGETVDRVTGRNWNPSSSLATSRLSEKLCLLLDEEVKSGDSGGKFAPHILTLKMQWNKFSPDADDELSKLRDELHAAAVDHINDKRYHTYAPLEIAIKTDYFTEGVRITGSFGKYGADEEEAAINVTLPNIRVEDTGEGSRVSIDLSEAEPVEAAYVTTVKLRFELNGRTFEKNLEFGEKTKRFTIGRGPESGVSIEHQSVSKVHATLVLNPEGKLLLADTGSTNGTYVSGSRIKYGKAIELGRGDTIRIGTVELEIEMPPAIAAESAAEPDLASGSTSQVEPPPSAETGVPPKTMPQVPTAVSEFESAEASGDSSIVETKDDDSPNEADMNIP